MLAFSIERSPSLYDGKRRKSTSLTTRPSTASPRNSNCSLSLTAAAPPLRDSHARELWVSARRSNSGLVNRCFSFNSRGGRLIDFLFRRPEQKVDQTAERLNLEVDLRPDRTCGCGVKFDIPAPGEGAFQNLGAVHRRRIERFVESQVIAGETGGLVAAQQFQPRQVI